MAGGLLPLSNTYHHHHHGSQRHQHWGSRQGKRIRSQSFLPASATFLLSKLELPPGASKWPWKLIWEDCQSQVSFSWLSAASLPPIPGIHQAQSLPSTPSKQWDLQGDPQLPKTHELKLSGSLCRSLSEVLPWHGSSFPSLSPSLPPLPSALTPSAAPPG